MGRWEGRECEGKRRERATDREEEEEEEERFYSPFGGNGAYWTQNSVSHARQRIFKQLFLLERERDKQEEISFLL